MSRDQQPRTVVRRSFPELVRVELLEDDADRFEAKLDAGIAEIRRAQKYSNGIGISILVAIIIALAGIALK